MTTTAMPDWLTHHLIAKGVMTESRLTRNARPRRCTRCGTYTLVGLDADTLAFEAHAEPTPTTSAGELQALLAGRRTWTLHHGRLEQRDADDIRLDPADQAGNIHAEHTCGSPPLPVHPAFLQTLIPQPATDQPPY